MVVGYDRRNWARPRWGAPAHEGLAPATPTRPTDRGRASRTRPAPAGVPPTEADTTDGGAGRGNRRTRAGRAPTAQQGRGRRGAGRWKPHDGFLLSGRPRARLGRAGGAQPAVDRADRGVGPEGRLERRPIGGGDARPRGADETHGAVLVARHHGHGV